LSLKRTYRGVTSSVATEIAFSRSTRVVCMSGTMRVEGRRITERRIPLDPALKERFPLTRLASIGVPRLRGGCLSYRSRRVREAVPIVRVAKEGRVTRVRVAIIARIREGVIGVSSPAISDVRLFRLGYTLTTYIVNSLGLRWKYSSTVGRTLAASYLTLSTAF